MQLKEQILLLRSQGYTYSQIRNETGASNGTISYYCSNHTENRIKKKIKDFKRVHKGTSFDPEYDWGYDEFVDKFNDVTECYLTGLAVDIHNPDTFSLDHVVPRSKGGTNSIDNIGICSSLVNKAKGDMSVDEFVTMCRKVVDKWETSG